MIDNIKYLFMDVDGTLTDGKIYMSPSGEIVKAFDIKDGCGLHDIALVNGLIPVIMTGRKSDIVFNRCKELGIDKIYQGVSDKLSKVKEIICEDNINASCIAYIGDDINDLKIMEYIKASGGVVGCPADAVVAVKNLADFVAVHNGGRGAVRDFIEWIVESKFK